MNNMFTVFGVVGFILVQGSILRSTWALGEDIDFCERGLVNAARAAAGTRLRGFLAEPGPWLQQAVMVAAGNGLYETEFKLELPPDWSNHNIEDRLLTHALDILTACWRESLDCVVTLEERSFTVLRHNGHLMRRELAHTSKSTLKLGANSAKTWEKSESHASAFDVDANVETTMTLLVALAWRR